MKHELAKFLKKIIYANGETYAFAGKQLKFLANTRPVKRKYIDHTSDVVRNDVLQIDLLENEFKQNHVMWDIGAHWGHYSIFGASIAENNNQIFAFEPDENARKTLLSNLALNGFEKKVTVFDSLISDVDGEVDFLDLGGNSNSHIVKNSAGQATVKKKTRTLNTLLNDLPVPDFIKIDTEGAEIDILRSGSALLNNHKVRFICELHPFAWDDFNVQYSEFEQLVKDSGRTIKLLDNNKRLEDLPFYGTVLF